MPSGFVHLHTHSYFSLLAGLASPEAMVARAAALGQSALALTDTNNMFGAVRFAEAADKAGLRAIFGMQLAVEPGGRIIVLAETMTGYRNLLKLAGAVRTERPLRGRGGSPHEPNGSVHGDEGVVSRELLFEWGDGLIVLSGGREGALTAWTAAGRTDEAKELAASFLGRFGREHFYIELQDQSLPGQAETNGALSALAEHLGVDVVATNDARYLEEGDARAHAALLALGARTTWDDPRRPTMGSARFTLASGAEMGERFAGYPRALANAGAIAARCDVRLQKGPLRLPAYRELPGEEGPAGGDEAVQEEWLRKRAWAGAEGRFGPLSDMGSSVRERLQHELDIICGRGLASYFLIVADIVHEAKARGIRVGPGRGSVAGSLVAYCLGITEVDPVAHGLVFERFLNPERPGMPDIDLDVADTGREELLGYIRQRFGEDRVAQIVTFGTLAARAAVREAGRVLGLERSTVDGVVRLLPSEPGITLDRSLRGSPELQRLLQGDGSAARMFNLARAVEGVPRHVSVHAAGVVIGDGPLHDDIPLMTTAEGVRITQYAMDDVEALGFLKMDVLGLRTLSVIDKAWQWIGREGDGLPTALEDPAVYKSLRQQGTEGIFQLETRMFQQLVRRLQPETFADIVALLALGRPGPMQRVDEFIERRHGRGTRELIHPILEPILRETYGIIVYQEQVMHIAMHVAGYSAAEADLLRRRLTDVGGDGGALSEAERERFLRGATKKGLSPNVGERILAELLQLAGYGFAKSHSVAYGMLTYETAFLRTHYPSAFLAALLASHMHRPDRIDRYVKAAKQWGVQVIGPDVNRSGVEFEPMEPDKSPGGVPTVVYGLAGLRHVGRGAAEAIVQARAEGPFRSFEDFWHRLPANFSHLRLLEALIRSGACDGFGLSREDMLETVGVTPVAGQASLFRGAKIESSKAFDTMETPAREIGLRLNPGFEHVLSELPGVLAAHRGDVPVTLQIVATGDRLVTIKVDRRLWVDDGPALWADLQRWIKAGKLTPLRRTP